MKFQAVLWLTGACFLAGCREKDEVTVTETREPATRDTTPKLMATSDERFKNAQPSPVRGETPQGWVEMPSSQFRLLNYRFGESGLGEVWVSLSSGTVLDNTNRWLGQFEAPALTEAQLQELRQVPIAGQQGVWVEAEGQYAAGMGAEPKPGYALAGVIVLKKGRILTVKMVGPKADVEAAKPTLEAYARGLQAAE